MGIAKDKMFGPPKKHWPRLHKLVEAGQLLHIDLAYAATQTDSEEEAATHAALISLARQGHFRLTKELLTDPILLKLAREGAFLPKAEYYEQQIADQIKRLLTQPIAPKTAPSTKSLNAEQNQALRNALETPISLITGGPGTGKTFTAIQIVRALETSTIVTAPTGKAASHLESQIDVPVQSGTLHSLLRVRGPLDYTKEIAPLDANLIIVDECSMIDPPLFARLLSSIPPGARLILMGDSNQLPAVEGGSIFADLIRSKKIPTATLIKCMRSDRHEILNLAASILDGTAQEIRNLDLGFTQASFAIPSDGILQPPNLCEFGAAQKFSRFSCFSEGSIEYIQPSEKQLNPEALARSKFTQIGWSQYNIEKIYENLWQHVKELDFNRFRILSTLRKGPLGVDALNAFLYDKFSALGTEFPIMIKRNDPRTGLTNGDTGILSGEEARFSAGRSFSRHELPSYEYAYCISVHKSQGSEYDHVLLLVPDGSEAFGKEVLYTAVTRAKQTLEIDGNPDQIKASLSRSSSKTSGLLEKLVKC